MPDKVTTDGPPRAGAQPELRGDFRIVVSILAAAVALLVIGPLLLGAVGLGFLLPALSRARPRPVAPPPARPRP